MGSGGTEQPGVGCTPPSQGTDHYLTIEDAAQVAGVTIERLRRLVRRGTLKYRGSIKDPLFRLADIGALDLSSSQTVPNWLLSPTKDEGQARPGNSVSPEEHRYAPNTVVNGHVLDVLRSMPASVVAACVCSPPYWGQRVYEDEAPVSWGDGSSVAFGRERTPEDYVGHTLEVLQALLPVLRPDATVWWNIADTYMTRTIMRASSKERVEHYGGARSRWAGNPNRRASAGHEYLKDKDLTLIPFLVATGAQTLGYWVRSIIVWSKQQKANDYSHSTAQAISEVVADSRAHVPEVVLDRPVTGHEYILLLTKSERYSYYPTGPLGQNPDATTANIRSVWTFPPESTRGNHGARFPEELPRRCILLGSKPGDLVFDGFAGAGTTLRIAHDLERSYFGCDISPTYIREARSRLAQPRLLPGSSSPITFTDGRSLADEFRE